MFSRIVLCMLCIAFATAAGGCNGAKETDEISYVVGIGLDTAPNNQITITYRMAIPAALAGGEGGGGKDKKTSKLVTIVAPSLAEGRNLLNSATSRAVSMSHIKVFAISEELARKGLENVIGPLFRFREFRGSMFITIVRGGTAKEIMEKNDPELESLISRWFESMLLTYDEASYYLPTNLHEFYKRLKGGSGSPYVVAMGLDDLKGTDKAEKGPVAGDKSKEYLPGQMPRQGGNPAIVIGTAVFKEDKLAGFLTNAQTRALGILLNKFPWGFIVIEDPLEPKKAVNVNIRLGNKPDIAVDVSSAIPTISIKVFIEGEISSIASGIQYENSDYERLLENQVSNVIYEQITEMLQLTQRWGTDVVNFGYHSRSKFGTIEEFDDYKWDRKYPQAKINVDVTTEIRRTGLMRKTTPIRRE